MKLRFRMVLDQVWVSVPLPPETRVGDRLLLGGEDCWLYGINAGHDRLVVLREGWEKTWCLSGS